jgi:hypothetical protein
MEFSKKKIYKLLNYFLASMEFKKKKFWMISRNPYINQISFHLHSQHSGSKKLS